MLIHSKEQWGEVPDRKEDEENVTDFWQVFLASWYTRSIRGQIL